MAGKSKTILFGAGDGGLRVHYMLSQQFEVIAFVDNDASKQGSTTKDNVKSAILEKCKRNR